MISFHIIHIPLSQPSTSDDEMGVLNNTCFPKRLSPPALHYWQWCHSWWAESIKPFYVTAMSVDLGSPPTRGEHLEGSVSSFSNGWQRLCTAQVSTGAYKEPALLVWMRVECLKRAERNVLRFKIKKLLLLYVAFIIQIGSQLFRDNTDKKSCSAGYIESSVPCWWQHAMSLFSYERYMPMGAAKPCWGREGRWRQLMSSYR